MTGVVNNTGARTGVVGTTVGTPAAGATTGMINNVQRFKMVAGNAIADDSGTNIYVACPSMSISATSGRHYVLIGSQVISPHFLSGDANAGRTSTHFVYYGTSARSVGDTNPAAAGDTVLSSIPIGRTLVTTSSVAAAGYYWNSYQVNFTAASTTTYYVHTAHDPGDNLRIRSYKDSTYPHYCTIFEVMP